MGMVGRAGSSTSLRFFSRYSSYHDTVLEYNIRIKSLLSCMAFSVGNVFPALSLECLNKLFFLVGFSNILLFKCS